jgi:hypothetical protein
VLAGWLCQALQRKLMEGARRQLRGTPVAVARLHLASKEGTYVAVSKAYTFHHRRSSGPLARGLDTGQDEGGGDWEEPEEEKEDARVCCAALHCAVLCCAVSHLLDEALSAARAMSVASVCHSSHCQWWE